MAVEPMDDSSEDSESESEGAENQYLIEHGSIENEHTAYFLANESFRHRLGQNSPKDGKTVPVEQIFVQYQLNSAAIWYGIIPDTGAAEVSTAGRTQVEALLI